MTSASDSALVLDRGVGTVLSVSALQERRDKILEIMANVLEEGKDYGRIPGTDKPTLYKPGAEQLMLTFFLAAADPRVEDLSLSDEYRYRVRVPIEDGAGRVVAVGIGAASSNEEKYRWRKPVCDEEFAETPEHLRREKWFKGKQGGSNYKGKQIRTSPADIDNTVLKMAHKRAFIHGTLLATGASSVFNQDLEDFTKELRDSIIEGEVASTPTEKKEVKRASETTGGTKPAAATNGGLITAPGKVKDVRVFGKEKNNYALTFIGDDKTEYTTKDAKLAAELEGFKGTDHKIRVRYEDNDWQGKTYHNIKAFAIADAEVPAAATAPPPSEPLTAGQIPFGK